MPIDIEAIRKQGYEGSYTPIVSKTNLPSQENKYDNVDYSYQDTEQDINDKIAQQEGILKNTAQFFGNIGTGVVTAIPSLTGGAIELTKVLAAGLYKGIDYAATGGKGQTFAELYGQIEGNPFSDLSSSIKEWADKTMDVRIDSKSKWGDVEEMTRSILTSAPEFMLGSAAAQKGLSAIAGKLGSEVPKGLNFVARNSLPAFTEAYMGAKQNIDQWEGKKESLQLEHQNTVNRINDDYSLTLEEKQFQINQINQSFNENIKKMDNDIYNGALLTMGLGTLTGTLTNSFEYVPFLNSGGMKTANRTMLQNILEKKSIGYSDIEDIVNSGKNFIKSPFTSKNILSNMGIEAIEEGTMFEAEQIGNQYTTQMQDKNGSFFKGAQNVLDATMSTDFLKTLIAGAGGGLGMTLGFGAFQESGLAKKLGGDSTTTEQNADLRKFAESVLASRDNFNSIFTKLNDKKLKYDEINTLKQNGQLAEAQKASADLIHDNLFDSYANGNFEFSKMTATELSGTIDAKKQEIEALKAEKQALDATDVINTDSIKEIDNKIFEKEVEIKNAEHLIDHVNKFEGKIDGFKKKFNGNERLANEVLKLDFAENSLKDQSDALNSYIENKKANLTNLAIDDKSGLQDEITKSFVSKLIESPLGYSKHIEEYIDESIREKVANSKPEDVEKFKEEAKKQLTSIIKDTGIEDSILDFVNANEKKKIVDELKTETAKFKSKLLNNEEFQNEVNRDLEAKEQNKEQLEFKNKEAHSIRKLQLLQKYGANEYLQKYEEESKSKTDEEIIASIIEAKEKFVAEKKAEKAAEVELEVETETTTPKPKKGPKTPKKITSEISPEAIAFTKKSLSEIGINPTDGKIVKLIEVFEERWVQKNAELSEILKNLDKNLDKVVENKFRNKRPNFGFMGLLSLLESNELSNDIFINLDILIDSIDNNKVLDNEFFDSLRPKINEFLELMDEVQQSMIKQEVTPIDQSELVTPVEATAKKVNKEIFKDGGSFSKLLGGSNVNSVETSYREVDGIGIAEFSNPNTNQVDVIMAGISDNEFVGYYRLYENGKTTNKWSSKFENQTKNKENFKKMISNVQNLLPVGHEYTEKTSISTDGLRIWNQQLSKGYTLQYGKDGSIITNEVSINGDSIVNELGITVNKGDFEDIVVRNIEDYNKVKKAVLPYLQKLGLNESNIRWNKVESTVKIDLPVLKKTKNTPETKVESTKTIEEQKADIEKRREEELEALPFTSDVKQKLDTYKKRDIERYRRELRNAAKNTEEGNNLLERYAAEDTLSNPNSTLEDRVAAKYYIEYGGPFNEAMKSDILKHINNIKTSSSLSQTDKEIKKIYDAELAKLKAEKTPTKPKESAKPTKVSDKNKGFSQAEIEIIIGEEVEIVTDNSTDGVTIIILKTKKGERIGFISTSNKIDGYEGITIGVNSDYQNKGISKHLYNLALASAKSRGLKGLFSVDNNLKTEHKSKDTRKNFETAKSDSNSKLNKTVSKQLINELKGEDAIITLITDISDSFEKQGAIKYDNEITKLKESQAISKNEITENAIAQLDNQTIVENENQQQEPKNKNILDILNKSKYSFLSEILKNIETELVWTKNNNVDGFYYLGKNKIEIGEHMLFSDHLEQTIAHEAIHAIIDQKTKGTEKRKEMELKITPFIKEIKNYYDSDDIKNEHIKRILNTFNKSIANKHGSFEEIITYSFTDKAFAKWLNSIPANGTKNISRTLWGKLKSIIIELLNPITGKTKLDELNEILDSIFIESNNKNENQELAPKKEPKSTVVNNPEKSYTKNDPYRKLLEVEQLMVSIKNDMALTVQDLALLDGQPLFNEQTGEALIDQEFKEILPEILNGDIKKKNLVLAKPGLDSKKRNRNQDRIDHLGKLLYRSFKGSVAFEMLNEAEFNKKAGLKKNIKYETKAFIDNETNVIYLNMDSAIGPETVLHEFSHPFIYLIRQKNPSLYFKLLDEALKLKVLVNNEEKLLSDKVATLYPELSGANLENELIVHAIEESFLAGSKKGNIKWTEENKLIIDRIVEFFNDVLNTLFEMVGIELNDIKDNLSIDRLTRLILSGKLSIDLSSVKNDAVANSVINKLNSEIDSVIKDKRKC